jgi:hypothetical protein
MIRLPILKDELAFLEKHLPELQSRPDLGQLAIDFKERIAKVREEIRALERGENPKEPHHPYLPCHRHLSMRFPYGFVKGIIPKCSGR